MSQGRPWTDARTLEDVGLCIADWLERKIDPMPTCARYERVSAETARLVPLLTALNRSGLFITTSSQPGCTPNDRWWGGAMPFQRAGIVGFVPAKAIARVRAALKQDKLCLCVAPPGTNSPHAKIPVSCRRAVATAHFGYTLSASEIARDYGGVLGDPALPGLNVRVIRVLQGCYQVTAVDRRWGCNSLLWPALARLV